METQNLKEQFSWTRRSKEANDLKQKRKLIKTTMSLNDYKLRCELVGHSLDVRALANGPAGEVISGTAELCVPVALLTNFLAFSFQRQNDKNLASGGK